MAKQNTNSKKGFTIIEVVLVLAIAGLIFLMVFIAWPALQRSQRDTQRRNDYSMLSTAISNYATNNNGKLSNILGTNTSKELDPSKYINENGEDPDGYVYGLIAYKCGVNTGNCTSVSAPNKQGGTRTIDGEVKQTGSQVFVVINADCTGDDGGKAVPAANSSSRSFAIYGYLEGGTQTFCSDSQ